MSVAHQRPIEKIVRPFRDFAHKQWSGGILLIIAIVVALVWANSPWSDSYADLWQTELTVGLEINAKSWSASWPPRDERRCP